MLKILQPPGRRRPVDAPSIKRQFKVKEVFDDYIDCQIFSGIGANALTAVETVKIAKPPTLRRSGYDVDFGTEDAPADRTLINGTVLTFTNLNVQKRKANDGTDDEVQVVIPNYVEGDIIYATFNIQGGLNTIDEDGAPVLWIDDNRDGRAWARADDQSDET